MKPNTRLKINKFIKKYGKLIGIVILAWLFILLLNNFLKRSQAPKKPTTTYTPHTAVLDSGSSSPKKVQNSIEKFVEEYVEHCNNKEYEKAYEMISEECKKNNFISFEDFKSYVNNKFNSKKIYSIQNYSNYDDKYIYSIKLYDDVLATGLTNSTYRYQEEKITVSYDENNNIVFSVGNFIEKEKVQSVQENEYLKVDVVNKIIKYSFEAYEVKFTNRSDKTIVIRNENVENEILLNIGAEYRTQMPGANIILEPNESTTAILQFNKLYDDGINSKSIIFNSIRVVENYIDDNPNEENSIYKFSMELGLE